MVYAKLDHLKLTARGLFNNRVTHWEPLVNLGSLMVRPAFGNIGSLMLLCDAIWLRLIEPEIDKTPHGDWAWCEVKMTPTLIDAQDLHIAVCITIQSNIIQLRRHFYIMDSQGARLLQLQDPNWVPTNENYNYVACLGKFPPKAIGEPFYQVAKAKTDHRDKVT